MGWGRHPLSRALDYECYHRPSLKAAGEAVVTVALQDLRAPYLVCHPRELCCRNLCSCLDVHAAFLSSVVFGFVLWKRFISPVTVIISMLRTGNLGRSGAWEDYYPLPSPKACAPNIPCVSATVWGEADTNSGFNSGHTHLGLSSQYGAAMRQ